jgi:hypothetical protein
MINTPVQLELPAEPTALPGSSQQTSADGANTMTREVSRPATIADKQSLMEASSDSIQPTEDDFFEIEGTEVPAKPADRMGTKTASEVREIVDKIKRRRGIDERRI